MKTPLFSLAVVATVLIAAIPAAPLCAQKPGGFSEVPEKDAEALVVAKFAVAAHDAKLAFAGIEKVQRQVVAGLNYRLTIQVTDKGKPRRADAVVWRKLDGTYQLTSWKWLEAAPARAGE